ncbi:MAG: pyridoxamine 5'-phosphate oxidase family protein [Bryobacteraceae bacterium]|jgi:nitroimidazol reductase NimA-like FMN-containing flavoprotein (pyridoxamine 5'-phosphate oxidase superfamily)
MTAFKDIRRSDRALTESQAREILARAEHGVLATLGADGWPYGVPVNHVLSGDVLYFHCAAEGHKLENIAREERVSFCAVAGATVLPAKLSTLYESAVAFGRAALVTDPAEKLRALELLAVRFCGTMTPEAERTIAITASQTAVVRIRLERITGKAHRSA